MLRAEKHATDIDREDGLELLQTQLMGELVCAWNRGVVHQDVDAAPAVDDLLHCGRDALLVAAVHLEGLGLDAGLPQGFGSGFAILGADLEDRDARAFLGEAPARRLADAGAPPGDD